MSVTVKKVESKKDLNAFIDFPNRLYKDNAYFCPKLYMDEVGTLSKDKNPAFEFCEADYFLAYKDGKLAGRVAAIVNKRANESWKHNEVRFGWIDFIDDPEVSKVLIDEVEKFGRERGMDTVTGPLGFTDFDAEGMLVEGYDKLCTMPLIYNYPYYVKHIESLGFQKETDWLEYKIHVPRVLSPKYVRIAEMVKERYGLKIHKLTRKEVFKEGWGKKIFDLINVTYGELYNFTNLTPGLINKYIDTYLSLLDLKFGDRRLRCNDAVHCEGSSEKPWQAVPVRMVASRQIHVPQARGQSGAPPHRNTPGLPEERRQRPDFLRHVRDGHQGGLHLCRDQRRA